jgi:hypothetical protein
MQGLTISRRQSSAIAWVSSETSSGLMTSTLSVYWREVKALCPLYVDSLRNAGLLFRIEAANRQKKFLYNKNRAFRLFAAHIDFDVGLGTRR